MNRSALKLLMVATTMAGLSMSARLAEAAPIPTGWTVIGNAGTNTAADGVVALAPGFSSYQWISTFDSPNAGGRLPVGPTGQETNGSYAQTPTFTVVAGDSLNFYFNYITSDGAEFTEYAWAGLFLGSSSFEKYLFTARTTPSGNTVPGDGLPGLGAGVVLTPPSTAIIPGGPLFSPLGDSSGECYDAGCGYTGWVRTEYTFTSAGTYSLGFGVTNALDLSYDTAFAIAGVSINDVPIDPNPTPVPEPTTLGLLGMGLLGLGGLARRRKTNAA